jgi:hypothetical protein
MRAQAVVAMLHNVNRTQQSDPVYRAEQFIPHLRFGQPPEEEEEFLAKGAKRTQEQLDADYQKLVMYLATATTRGRRG